MKLFSSLKTSSSHVAFRKEDQLSLYSNYNDSVDSQIAILNKNSKKTGEYLTEYASHEDRKVVDKVMKDDSNLNLLFSGEIKGETEKVYWYNKGSTMALILEIVGDRTFVWSSKEL